MNDTVASKELKADREEKPIVYKRIRWVFAFEAKVRNILNCQCLCNVKNSSKKLYREIV